MKVQLSIQLKLYVTLYTLTILQIKYTLLTLKLRNKENHDLSVIYKIKDMTDARSSIAIKLEIY